MDSIIFAVLAGIAVTMQNSMNGLMTPVIGAMGTSAIGFTVQVILITTYQLLKERRMVSIKNVPPIYFSSGVIATITVGTIGVCVSQMGSAVTTCCSVAGQIIMSTIVDHFGLFGTKKKAFKLKRVPGFLMILGGVLIINLLGGSGANSVSLGYLFLAVFLGFCAIVIRTLNHKATQAAGSSIGGGFINSLSGMVSGWLFFFLVSGFHPNFSLLPQVPAICYLAGVFGTGSLLFNIFAYRKENIFYATIFMLLGQVSTGILMDVYMFHSLSSGKCIGIAIILVGVLLDKMLNHADA